MQLVKSYQIIGRRFNSKTLDLISCHIFPIVSIVSVRQWQSVSVCRHKVNNVHTIYLINVFKAKVDAKSHETSILLLIHIPPLNFNLEFHWYHCPYDGRQTVSVIRISWQTQKSLSSLSWHQHRLFLEIECCSYPEFELPRKSLREEKKLVETEETATMIMCNLEFRELWIYMENLWHHFHTCLPAI